MNKIPRQASFTNPVLRVEKKKSEERREGGGRAENVMASLEYTLQPRGTGGSPLEHEATNDVLHVDDGHRFGNFPNYYAFHQVEDRLDLLSDVLLSTWLSSIKPGSTFNVIDVGCNDGTLTRTLHHKLLAAAPPSVLVRTMGLELDPLLVDRARDHCASELSDGSMSFEAGDATDESLVAASTKAFLGSSHRFDLVTCFSTTMWIHVNHGDEKFKGFLNHMAALSTRLIVEPQPWRCYRAVRVAAKML